MNTKVLTLFKFIYLVKSIKTKKSSHIFFNFGNLKLVLTLLINKYEKFLY